MFVVSVAGHSSLQTIQASCRRLACLPESMSDGPYRSCSRQPGSPAGAIRRNYAARHGAAVSTPEPGSWQHDLVELLEIFERHEVPYLIAGGHAVAHAGHLRATKDVDIYVPQIAGASERSPPRSRSRSSVFGVDIEAHDFALVDKLVAQRITHG